MYDILLFIFFVVVTKIIEDNLPNFTIQLQPENLGKTEEKIPSFNLEKALSLSPIARLYELPYFTICNPTSDREFIQVFYDVAIELTLTLKLPDRLMPYYIRNFVPNRNLVHTKEELIEYLLNEQANPNRHDSRYLMGFRSIFFILHENLDKIDSLYIHEIKKKCSPFFKHYKYPHLLVAC